MASDRCCEDAGCHGSQATTTLGKSVRHRGGRSARDCAGMADFKPISGCVCLYSRADAVVLRDGQLSRMALFEESCGHGRLVQRGRQRHTEARVRVAKNPGTPKGRAMATDVPELGERSMLRLIAATSPHEVSSYVTALAEAISRWTTAAENDPGGDLESELERLHALKSVTSALGSLMIANACDDLADGLRSGVASEAVRKRSCAVAAAAQRLLQRPIVPHR